MDARIDRQRALQPQRGCDIGQGHAEYIRGRAHLGEPVEPPLFHHQRRVKVGGEVPQVRVAAQRGDLLGDHPSQPERPVLRIGQDPAGAGELRGEGARLPVELRPDIEPAGQARREALGEIRPRPVIGIPVLVGAGELVVEHRQRQRPVGGDQRRRSAVGARADGVDREFGVELAQRAERECPQPVNVEMRVLAVPQHGVRALTHRDLRAAVEVHHRHLGVGFADIDDPDGTGSHFRAIR